MRELPALLILDFLAFCLCARCLYRYAFTEKDEIFSNYRNRIDVSESHFERWLLKKRIAWWSLTLLFGGLFIFLFSL